MTFEKELSALINKHGLERPSDTPDYILANYLQECLACFNEAMINRESWYGRRTTKPLDHADDEG